MTFSDLSPFANHLWQSTLFAAVAWVLTLTLRKNRAAVRYWLWLAASVKFLIPFAWVARLGARFAWPATQVAGTARIPVLAEQIGQPFQVLEPAALAAAAAPAAHLWPAVLLVCWICGMAVGVVFWIRSMWRMGRILREAKALDLNLPIPVKATSRRMEPGVFGIWRPELLLPEGITERLTPGQLKTILSHELCHVHRRDNLTAAIHMLVETIFWFHPAVWWIRTRLAEERERACDEGVLRLGGEPRVYAESILEVCEFYLSAPVALTAGVTGGELKKRIEGIMENRFGLTLGFGKRALLATAALATLILPLALGALRAGAQTDPGVGLAAVAAVSGQDTPMPRFEVASVKPGGSVVWTRPNLTPGRIRWTTELAYLIGYAYGLDFSRVDGSHLGSVYAVEATFDPAATEDQVRLMVRSLLVERFKMQAHRIKTQEEGYALVVGKRGLKIREDTESRQASSAPVLDSNAPGATNVESYVAATVPEVHVVEIGARKATMSQLAVLLHRVTRTPTWDRTGLSGSYSFSFRYARDLTADRQTDYPPLAAALRENLGLEMKKQKGPVETVIVDHIEAPSQN